MARCGRDDVSVDRGGAARDGGSIDPRDAAQDGGPGQRRPGDVFDDDQRGAVG